MSTDVRFGMLVGRSALMQELFKTVARIADNSSPVLITGETGTGKEAAAETLHRASSRGEGPFVIFDCSATPPGLVESELFGCVRGAYSGADQDRPGLFEAASGGTLFFDEIGELPVDVQSKLLRAIEKQEVRRIGATRYEKIDVRIVAATNRNLTDEVRTRRLRSDLFYRLSVFRLTLPPLRDRLDDLPLLVDRLLEGIGDVNAGSPLRSDEFLEALRSHGWPGNVRELRNHLERCHIVGKALPVAARHEEARVEPFRAARAEWERDYFERLLGSTRNNATEAAHASGLDRGALYRYLWRHGLR